MEYVFNGVHTISDGDVIVTNGMSFKFTNGEFIKIGEGNDANKVKPLKVDRSREYPMMTNFDSNDKIHPDCIELTSDTPIGNGMTIKDVARHKDVVKLEKRVKDLEREMAFANPREGDVRSFEGEIKEFKRGHWITIESKGGG